MKKPTLTLATFMAFSMTGAFAQTTTTSPATAKPAACTIVIEVSDSAAYVKPRSGSGSCQKGAAMSFKGYQLIPFFVEQVCDLSKPVNKFNTENPNDPTFDRITCTYTGEVAEPARTYSGLRLVVQ